MESKLPKPTSLKKPAARACVPSDRLVATAPASTLPLQNGNKLFTLPAKLPPQLANRTALTQNFENVRNALGGGGLGERTTRKRHGSPDLGVKVARPKLRRSMSFNDINSIANLTTMKPPKKIVLPTFTKPRRPLLTAPKPFTRDNFTSKPTVGTAASKATTINNRPTVKATATTKASATLTVTKGNAKPRIPPYDFKARFNDLTTRHTALREKYDALNENLKEYETLPEQYEECQQKLFQTENELRNVKVQLECLQRQTSADKTKIDSLAEQLATKTEQFRVCDEANQTLRNENKSITTEVTELRVTKMELSGKNETLEEQLREAKEIMYRFNLERKDLHNTIMDLRGNIRVFCRVRPPLDVETNRTICAWQYHDETSLEIGKLFESILPSFVRLT